MSRYNLKSLQLPKLTGFGLSAFAQTAENRAGRALLINSLLENGGIPYLRRVVLHETPTFYPLKSSPAAGAAAPVEAVEPGALPEGFPYVTVGAYAAAYRRGDCSPLQVAEKVLAAIDASEQADPPLRAFIAVDRRDVLAQAERAEKRLRAGQPLSLLDGVPVAIKDEIDQTPYPTTVGTRFLGSAPAAQDASVVARLRAAGALLIGKTNMHEIGINPNGSNANHGHVRNPHDPLRDTGGSSSGSAAAVAAGLCPLAIGADGGGSIRIPATLCGVVGIKPTYGRVSEAGAAPLCWSVAHLGPLGASVADVALAYALIAGPDGRDPNSLVQPPPRLEGWNRTRLNGVTLGIYPAWFEHASPGVAAVCKEMLRQLGKAGATIREIEIPELDEMRIAHAITILAEMAVCMQPHRRQRRLQGASVRLSLVLGEALTASDYLQAQRMRTRALAIFAEAFKEVDAILTPGTAITAPLLPAGAPAGGWSDLGSDTELMRYAFPGNLTGLPAISFPAGYDEQGLPVGLQAMGRHWEEHLLFGIAHVAEQVVARRKPRIHYPLL